ncbi:glycosyltransferase family 4 protein [Pararhodospirillum oryzae]|uniref:Glycosyl transferase family 1 domain-containing protein n=1 Tax=Pararhodospirillum oryzae TaxID=478448 RepID=A0A512H3R8_9PROT|nr:glycosyltransferase family 4 protein [Pararhodospirillum oryzae]GEO80073.1 hypothetical protein ROR02_02040 [Pararhodospirillum oryzae]
MRVGIAWQMGLPSGWGTYALNLALQLSRLGHRPVPFSLSNAPLDQWLDPLGQRLLAPALAEHARMNHLLALHGELDLPYLVLHGLADGLDINPFSDQVRGQPDVGVVFFESALVPGPNLAAAERFKVIITGSSWNQMVLEAHGVTHARLHFQGIDPSVFHPAPRAGLMPPGRFVVFSGGKLEYRKGQDIVIAAFRIFHQRHPDALLVTAWHNLWPECLETLEESPHVDTLPTVDGRGRLCLGPWFEGLGLSPDAVLDLGPLANAATARVLRECDLAVFPNRCEGGTNLVAMEAMACGVPAIVSANTGHLDLIAGQRAMGEPVCWSLTEQGDLTDDGAQPWRTGWGETSVEELVEAMEDAYVHRERATRRGQAGARFLARWSWEAQVKDLMETLNTLA